ncbi:alanine--tRNA ligase [Roseiterribacter gracilis]|uniref:Alanine--tRNA ligase n=1 Tax=Roseiterribacter gracilis TaxID=2812848 RepID=A0A8S8XHP0_9PROT|nr:alanine--tRNA ligase [Rhodospirillales bacterium TMPK1]
MVTTAAEIRRTFLEYFQGNAHTIVPSSPLVPRNDPTLMFTNSGMVQFKDVFTGKEQRPYNRATSSQKSVRAGGKHNDLENVGYTTRHHTFFEMLGNFSFGAVEGREGTKSYFKADAIEYAWTLLTKSFALDPKRLTVTVFHEDEEAHGLWKKIAGFSDDKIIRIATSDNFWRMGDLGPCGPCTEIFWDHGDKIWGGPPGSKDEDGDRFVEIWNLVFMQFEQRPGELVPLPKPSVDTGMGLERIATVLQGVHDNYDIDLMRALVVAAADATSTDPDGAQKVSHRVIADHLRSTSFLIADGVLPSNEGRGYVLRRILRRAARHAHLLGSRDPLLYRLVPTLVREMGRAYPELVRAEKMIVETLKLEETRFKATLERGLKLLDEATSTLPQGTELPGDTAFKLYDTFGFPLDLTQDVLRGQGRSVDVAGFDTAMAKQKAEARKAWAGTGEAATDAQWFELRDELGATEFLGYDTERAQGRITAILVAPGSGSGAGSIRAHEATQGARVELLVNQTPFYGESGGQVGDAGVITSAGGARIVVRDTQKKLGQLFVHSGTVEGGAIAVGDEVELQVDHARRSAIRANHSATHLLHEALRRRMGEHVAQKGSLVSPDRLRFDISQPTPLSAQDIAAVEAEVNQRVRGDSEVTTQLMTPDEAIAQGAMALFGEKYGDEVRVVAMGGREDGANKDYSVELCGGTHVGRTGEIGLVKIVGESAVSAGVRRIEALTGIGALAWIAEQEALVKEAAAALKSTPSEVPARVLALVEERKRLEREVTELRRKLASGETEGGAETKQVNGVTLVARRLTDVPAKDLKPLADDLKKKAGSGVVALAAATDGKLSLVVGVTDDLTAKISAVDLVRVAAEAAGGKGGGGRADMAQAGGPDPALADAALAAIEKALGA